MVFNIFIVTYLAFWLGPESRVPSRARDLGLLRLWFRIGVSAWAREAINLRHVIPKLYLVLELSRALFPP